MSDGAITEKTLTEEFIDKAKATAAKSCCTSAESCEHYANAALAHMQSAALADQYERLRPPAEFEPHAALVAYRDLALGLEAQFRAAGTDTSLRIAARIKAVIDAHG